MDAAHHDTLDLLLRYATNECTAEECAQLSRRLRADGEARGTLRELALQAIAVAELTVTTGMWWRSIGTAALVRPAGGGNFHGWRGWRRR